VKIRVLFVCLGNICRSPTAEGVLRALVREADLADRIEVDSAGTGDWHVGDPPDERSREEAARRGVAVQGAARQIHRRDFTRWDYIVAMDRDNLRELRALAPHPEARRKLHLLRHFEAESEDAHDVPDPYYGGAKGFSRVFEICDRSCRGLLAHLSREHGL